MIIDTRTIEGIISSLTHYLDITADELFDYIDYAADKAQEKSLMFDSRVFQRELLSIFSDLQPEESIDEIFVYHLTRRLNNSFDDLSTTNLKSLLLTPSAVSSFLQDHNITFSERDGHLVIVYNGNEVPLTNTWDSQVCYLRSRLGYNSSRQDYCFNGFALKDSLLKNSYAISLSFCPEFIDALSRYLKAPLIIDDYLLNSTYFCLTYKFGLDEILFDGNEQFNRDEKIDFFLVQLCTRLMIFKDSGSDGILDDDNPIIRLHDTKDVSSSQIVQREIITQEMLCQ